MGSIHVVIVQYNSWLSHVFLHGTPEASRAETPSGQIIVLLKYIVMKKIKNINININ